MEIHSANSGCFVNAFNKHKETFATISVWFIWRLMEMVNLGQTFAFLYSRVCTQRTINAQNFHFCLLNKLRYIF